MAQMWITMGPQHPMTHGLWTLRVKVDGETVVDTEAELGYIHRGVEKICEARDFTQVTPYCDRLCYVSAMTWANSYIYAAEDLLEADVPERAEYIRLISAELQTPCLPPDVARSVWTRHWKPDAHDMVHARPRNVPRSYCKNLVVHECTTTTLELAASSEIMPVGFADRTASLLKSSCSRSDSKNTK